MLPKYKTDLRTESSQVPRYRGYQKQRLNYNSNVKIKKISVPWTSKNPVRYKCNGTLGELFRVKIIEGQD